MFSPIGWDLADTLTDNKVFVYLDAFRGSRQLSLNRHWNRESLLCQISITGGNGGCHNDNLRCHQWPQSWHCGFFRLSVDRSFHELCTQFVTSYGLVWVSTSWFYTYPSGLVHWHWGNHTIAPVPAKQPWRLCVHKSWESIQYYSVTTTKQSTTKLYAYFLGYTVRVVWGSVQ